MIMIGVYNVLASQQRAGLCTHISIKTSLKLKFEYYFYKIGINQKVFENKSFDHSVPLL